MKRVVALWLVLGGVAGAQPLTIHVRPSVAQVAELRTDGTAGAVQLDRTGTVDVSNALQDHVYRITSGALDPITARVRWNSTVARWTVASCTPVQALPPSQWTSAGPLLVDSLDVRFTRTITLPAEVSAWFPLDADAALGYHGATLTLPGVTHTVTLASLAGAAPGTAVVPVGTGDVTVFLQRPLFDTGPLTLSEDELTGAPPPQVSEARLRSVLKPKYGPLSYRTGQVVTLFVVVLLLGGGLVLVTRRARRRRQDEQTLAMARQVEAASRDLVSDRMPPLVGKRLRTSRTEYVVLRLLGEGGMGAVFEAAAAGTDESCAIKLLFPDLGGDAGYQQRFEREIQMCSALHHPGIVKVLDWGTYQPADSPQPWSFMVMELVRGRDLRAVIVEACPRPVPDVVAWMLEGLKALKAAHAAGIIHRDLKPENIMLTAAGHVKIMDFGVARQADAQTLTRTNTALGTPAYMSPEHVDARQVVPASDVYSMGVTMYELLSGRRPFEADDPYMGVAKMLTERPTSLSVHRPDLPEALVAVVMRMVEPDVALRYATADAALEALTAQEPGG